MNAGETRYTVSADVRAALGALGQFSNSVENTERKAVASFGAMGRASEMLGGQMRRGLNMASAAAGGMITSLALLARQATQAAGAVQEGDLALQALGRTQGYARNEIDKTVKKIKEGGIETRIAQEAATTFMQQNLKLADAAKIAASAQDIAVASSENSTETFRQLSYAIQTGGTNLNVFRKLQIQSGQEWVKYAAQIGKSSRALTDQERSQALVNAVLREGAKFAGLYAEAQAESFTKIQRSFARYKEEFLEAFGKPLLGAAFQWTKFKQAILGGLDDVAQKTGVLKDIGTMLEEFLVPAVAKAEAFMRKLADSPAWKTMQNVVRTVFKAMTENSAAALVGITGLAAGTAAFVSNMAGSIPILGGVVNALGSSAKTVGIVGALIALMASTEAGRKSMADIGKTFSDVSRQALPALLEMLQTVAESLAKISGPALVGGVRALTSLVSPLAAVAGVAGTMLGALAPVFGLIERMPPAVTQFVATLLLVRKGMEVLPGLAGKWMGQLRASTSALMSKARASGDARSALDRYRAGVEGVASAERSQAAATLAAAQALKLKQQAGMTPAPVAGGAGPVRGPAGFGAGGPGMRAPVARGGPHPFAAPPVAAIAGTEKLATGVGKLAVVSKTAGGALRGLSGFLGGPWGIALTAAFIGVQKFTQELQELRAEGSEAAAKFAESLPTADTAKVAAANLKIMRDELARSEKNLAKMKAGLHGLPDSLISFSASMERTFIGGEQLSESYEKQKQSLEEQRDAISRTGAELNKLALEEHKLGEETALKKKAEEANNLAAAMRNAASIVGGILSDAYAKAQAEAQFYADKQKQAADTVTRSFRQIAAAEDFSTRSSDNFGTALRAAGDNSKAVSAAQQRYVEQLIKVARASSETAITEEELLRIRQDAMRQVAQITAQELRLRREREAANFSYIVSFDLLKDSVRTLESLQERGKDAAQALAPDPSVSAAYGGLKKQITSLLDEFAERTKSNAAVLSQFVNNVNFLAKKGHMAFAHELIGMGVEGADLAKEAVDRMKSGAGLGALPKAMKDAANAAKKQFDERAVRWGPNFGDMASKAVMKLAPIRDGVAKTFEEASKKVEPSMALIRKHLDKGLEDFRAYQSTLKGIGQRGNAEMEAVLRGMGPSAAGLAKTILGAMTKAPGSLGDLPENIRSIFNDAKKGMFDEKFIEDAVAKATRAAKIVVKAFEKPFEEHVPGGTYKTGVPYAPMSFVMPTKHGGGPIFGGPNVPIMAQGGEWVLNRAQVQRIGPQNLARLPKYHTGGPVRGSDGASSPAPTAVVHINAGTVVGRGYDDLTQAVVEGLAKVGFRNVDTGVRGARR